MGGCKTTADVKNNCNLNKGKSIEVGDWLMVLVSQCHLTTGWNDCHPLEHPPQSPAKLKVDIS